MHRMYRSKMVLGLAVIVILVASVFSEPQSQKDLVLIGGTIYTSPVDKPIANGVILIRNGKIESVGSKDRIEIPPNTISIDCTGTFITAGFQNSHVHFTEEKWADVKGQDASKLNTQLEEMLTRYGFTTVVDTGSMLENTVALRNRIESSEIKGPRIFTAGSPLYPENGIPFYLKDLPPDILSQLATPFTPEEAAAKAKERIQGGADIVKIFTGSWIKRGEVLNMRADIAKSVVDQAHRNGKIVFSHASNLSGLEVALAAKVDVIAHALDDDRGWTPAHATKMKANKMSMIPTLKLFSGPKYFQFILKQVGDFSNAGGQILFGTDVGYMTDYDTGPEYGYMAQAGLSWQQILASLTTAPAERFNETMRRGRIAKGLDADIVVLASDPSKNSKAFADIKYTIRGGQTIYARKMD